MFPVPTLLREGLDVTSVACERDWTLRAVVKKAKRDPCAHSWPWLYRQLFFNQTTWVWAGNTDVSPMDLSFPPFLGTLRLPTWIVWPWASPSVIEDLCQFDLEKVMWYFWVVNFMSLHVSSETHFSPSHSVCTHTHTHTHLPWVCLWSHWCTGWREGLQHHTIQAHTHPLPSAWVHATTSQPPHSRRSAGGRK